MQHHIDPDHHDDLTIKAALGMKSQLYGEYRGAAGAMTPWSDHQIMEYLS